MKFKHFLDEMTLDKAAKKLPKNKAEDKALVNLAKNLKKLKYEDDIRHTVINIDDTTNIQFNAEEKDSKYLNSIEKVITKTVQKYCPGTKLINSKYQRSMDKTGYTYIFMFNKN